MRNETGDVIGIRLRCPVTAKKWAVKGSAAGLFYSPSLLSVERHGRLWIVEGPTDAAAMLSLGFDCVGVPSAGCGVEYLTELARRILPGEVVILADRDEAGRRGAERLSDALVIVAPVRIVSPPQGIKDARAWVCSGACRDAIELAADCVSVQSVVMEGE
jgi:DNA primase